MDHIFYAAARGIAFIKNIPVGLLQLIKKNNNSIHYLNYYNINDNENGK